MNEAQQLLAATQNGGNSMMRQRMGFGHIRSMGMSLLGGQGVTTSLDPVAFDAFWA